MRGTTVTATVTVEVETCYQCGTPFGIESDLLANLRKNGHVFYCPAGHSQVFIVGKTDAQKLRELTETTARQLEAERNRTKYWRDEQERTERRRIAAQGQATKLKKRAVAGACPCCNRTFVNLAKHVAGQHPGFRGSIDETSR